MLGWERIGYNKLIRLERGEAFILYLLEMAGEFQCDHGSLYSILLLIAFNLSYGISMSVRAVC